MSFEKAQSLKLKCQKKTFLDAQWNSLQSAGLLSSLPSCCIPHLSHGLWHGSSLAGTRSVSSCHKHMQVHISDQEKKGSVYIRASSNICKSLVLAQPISRWRGRWGSDEQLMSASGDSEVQSPTSHRRAMGITDIS